MKSGGSDSTSTTGSSTTSTPTRSRKRWIGTASAPLWKGYKFTSTARTTRGWTSSKSSHRSWGYHMQQFNCRESKSRACNSSRQLAERYWFRGPTGDRQSWWQRNSVCWWFWSHLYQVLLTLLNMLRWMLRLVWLWFHWVEYKMSVRGVTVWNVGISSEVWWHLRSPTNKLLQWSRWRIVLSSNHFNRSLIWHIVAILTQYHLFLMSFRSKPLRGTWRSVYDSETLGMKALVATKTPKTISYSAWSLVNYWLPNGGAHATHSWSEGRSAPS